MKPRDDRAGAVFSALGDPTRRALLDRLAQTPSATATELAATVPMTRQAVVKHMQALDAAGLITPARAGREVRYTLTPNALEDAVAWMLHVGGQWDNRLERLSRQLTRGDQDD